MVEAFDSTPFGHVLVQFKTGLVAADPATGKHVWSRPDVTDYLAVTGTPFGVFTTASGQSVADLESGQDRWKLASLQLSSVKGLVHLPAVGLLLVYGPTPENPHTLVAAKYESGEVVWKQTSLFKDSPLAAKASKIEYRTYQLDTNNTVILDPTEDGLMRLDLQTGRPLWKIPEDRLDSKDKDVVLFVTENQILVAFDKKLLAISRDPIASHIFSLRNQDRPPIDSRWSESTRKAAKTLAGSSSSIAHRCSASIR